MSSMKIELPQMRWYGDIKTEIEFPESWNVSVVGTKGDELPPLTYEQMRDKINAPVGTKKIRELAEGKRKAVIIFDDITRGTPIKELAHIVLAELHAAGFTKDNIIFICALGLHAAESRIDFAKKLGEDIVRDYYVFNHDPFVNLEYVGTTPAGTPVEITKEAATCDLKIGIGAMTPHPFNAFGGGCKIILPGICSYKTVLHNHDFSMGQIMKKNLGFASQMGNLDNREMREDIENAGRLAGLDFKIDTILNTSCEIVDLFAGDPVEEYYAAIPRAKELYHNHVDSKCDVVVVNANAKLNEAITARSIGEQFVKEGGDIVLINFAPTGQVTHYLAGPWGTETPGAMFRYPKHLDKVNRLIIYSPYPDRTSELYFAPSDQLVWAESWDQVMDILSDHGSGTTSLVIRDGTIQYLT